MLPCAGVYNSTAAQHSMLNVVNTTLDTMLDWLGFWLSNPGATKEQQGVHHLGGTTVWTDGVGQMK